MHIIKTTEQLHTIPLTQSWIGYDLEFSSLDVRKGILLLMSITTEQETYVIDCTALTKKDLQYLKPLFETALCIGANITIDYKYTYHHLGMELRYMSDVMVLEQMLTAGLFIPSTNGKPFSLQSITQRRLGISLKKDIREEFIHYSGTLSDAAYIYAGEDTQCLKAIYDQQCAEIEKHKLEKIKEIEDTLLSVTAMMEYTGVPLNIHELHALEMPFQRYLQTCERMFQDIFISQGAASVLYFGAEGYKCLNINSRDQVIAAFNMLGLDITSLSAKELVKWDYKNRKRKDNISFQQLLNEDEEDIADAIDRFGGYENPYLRAYAFYKRADKLMTAYIIGLQKRYDFDTKRIYPWYKQCGARSTGRYSSDIQQIPKDNKLKELGIHESIRSCIQAPEGKVFFYGDFSAIELVILADRSDDKRLAHEIQQGDVHLVVTKEVLGKFIPIALEITQENKGSGWFKTLRDFSKIISYGIAYGITGKNLYEQAQVMLGSLFTHFHIKISIEQWDDAIEYWKKTFSGAGKYLNESANMAVTKGYTDSYLGRKRFFDLEEIKKNKWKFLAAQREGSNQRIQSTSADMTKLSLIYCYELLDKERAQLILTVHDENVGESTVEYAEEAARILKESMERAAREVLPNLGHTVQVEIHITERYDK